MRAAQHTKVETYTVPLFKHQGARGTQPHSTRTYSRINGLCASSKPRSVVASRCGLSLRVLLPVALPLRAPLTLRFAQEAMVTARDAASLLLVVLKRDLDLAQRSRCWVGAAGGVAATMPMVADGGGSEMKRGGDKQHHRQHREQSELCIEQSEL